MSRRWASASGAWSAMMKKSLPSWRKVSWMRLRLQKGQAASGIVPHPNPLPEGEEVLAIDLASMPDTHNPYHFCLVVDLVDDAPGAYAYSPVALRADHLARAGRSRVRGKGSDNGNDALEVP